MIKSESILMYIMIMLLTHILLCLFNNLKLLLFETNENILSHIIDILIIHKYLDFKSYQF